MRINSRAWTGEFRAVPWPEIAARFNAMAARHLDFRHMADIVESVLACQGADGLPGSPRCTTSS